MYVCMYVCMYIYIYIYIYISWQCGRGNQELVAKCRCALSLRASTPTPFDYLLSRPPFSRHLGRVELYLHINNSNTITNNSNTHTHTYLHINNSNIIINNLWWPHASWGKVNPAKIRMRQRSSEAKYLGDLLFPFSCRIFTSYARPGAARCDLVFDERPRVRHLTRARARARARAMPFPGII